MTSHEVRRVTDSGVLVALAHPLRRRLMDVLKVYGSATVGTFAERTGQAPANVSHHLRVLGAAGLIEEAPELARDRRERWWRLASTRVQWSNSDFEDDPTSQAVAQAAQSLNIDRHMSLARAWFSAGEDERRPWGDHPFSTDRWLHLTPDELREVESQILAVLEQWGTRELPDDGQHREPVFLFAYGIPAKP
jgi:DNA-binding transcriptional ArsR family regulator